MPFVGACIHVPPPPANQIVYVQAPKGFAGQEHVRSRLRHRHDEDETSFTGLADAGYTLDAERVDPRKE